MMRVAIVCLPCMVLMPVFAADMPTLAQSVGIDAILETIIPGDAANGLIVENLLVDKGPVLLPVMQQRLTALLGQLEQVYEPVKRLNYLGSDKSA